MVQGIFDDLSPVTRSMWAYPDTGAWDPERNTREFVAAMPEWRRHGLLAFTINLQGGSPQGYSNEQPWHNSAFKDDGSLRGDYLARLERILDRADELGMVVILGLFYFGQDQRLRDEEAVKRGVDDAVSWIFAHGYKNVLVEVNNECDVESYDHEILKPRRVHELIERVKAVAPAAGRGRLLAGTSFKGGSIPETRVVRASDFLLLHGNGVSDPRQIAAMARRTREVEGFRPMPILFNEDDHYDFEKPANNLAAAVGEHVSWGFFDYRRGEEGFEEGFQSVPVSWGISSERKRGFFGAVARMTGALSAAERPSASAAKASGSREALGLSALLEPLRGKFELPALAAAVVRGEEVVALGAVGVRKVGAPDEVTAQDKFHIGSCTKSMTATLAAMLIEEGKVSWGTQIADVFPERAAGMDPRYRKVTLEQLLSHRGGTPASLDADGLWARIWEQKGTPVAQRLFLLDGVLAKPPDAPPGTKLIYSNAGYAIAGAMLERVMGKPWEELMRERIFKPLGMSSAGFGAPASPAMTDQPWGHTAGSLALRPVPPGPGADNPAAIGPAGTVHCSIGDLARYAAFHLKGARGEGKLLKPETFLKLHTPVNGQDHALGWLAVERDWAGGAALTHTGSNTMFFTVIWIAPRKDFAVVVATNLGSEKAGTACDQTAWALIQEFLVKRATKGR